MYIPTMVIRGEDVIVLNVGAELGPRLYTCCWCVAFMDYRLL